MKPNSIPSAGTEDATSTTADVTTSCQTIAKPNVGSSAYFYNANRLSKNYEELYKILCLAYVPICLVDYRFDFSDKTDWTVKDVCKIVRHKEYHISFSARGIQYGGVEEFEPTTKTEKELFVNECLRMNVEWITN
jgi:hypothetical protein